MAGGAPFSYADRGKFGISDISWENRLPLYVLFTAVKKVPASAGKRHIQHERGMPCVSQ